MLPVSSDGLPLVFDASLVGALPSPGEPLPLASLDGGLPELRRCGDEEREEELERLDRPEDDLSE